jgi:hypothetical protein
MFRYQESPEAFSSVTWACHVACGDYTNWRVLPADASLIPPEHCPESWGRREAWLEQVRLGRRRAAARFAPRAFLVARCRIALRGAIGSVYHVNSMDRLAFPAGGEVQTAMQQGRETTTVCTSKAT